MVGAVSRCPPAHGGSDLTAADRQPGSRRHTRGSLVQRQPYCAEHGSNADVADPALGPGREAVVSTSQKARVADDLVRRLAAAFRGAQLYAPGHPIAVRNVTALADILAL